LVGMTRRFLIPAGILLLVCLWRISAVAGTISATAAVSSSEVFVGETFTLQIQVSGSESPEKPDLSGLDGFSVSFQGGSQNSSSAITIINGRMTRTVQEGYVFSYQLTPLREGRLTIPAITVHAGGDAATTRPLTITAQKPSETDDFKLRVSLSKTRCYVGEPVTLTVTWYLGSDVQSPAFTLPVLDKTDMFYMADPKPNTDPQKEYYRIPLGNGQVIAEKGRGDLDGRAYTTLSFQKVLIPKKSGVIRLDPATVSCKTLVGYRRQQSPFDNDFFSDFFDHKGFGEIRRGVYRQTVVPSNPCRLAVDELPAAGRPSDFSGLVGEYEIRANATPTSMSVGDPITLTLTISGPEYLEPVELPPLADQTALSRDFKIPSERATGEILGDKKVFTQTIRPLCSDITAIPPITLPYFDTRSGAYQTAKTEPIPIKVSPTRIITAGDAEGSTAPVPMGSDVETWSAGIAHNYEDERALIPQIQGPIEWLSSIQGIATIFLPPFVYLMLLFGSVLNHRRKADPLSAKAKKAGPQLVRAVKSARHAGSAQASAEVILEGFKVYLGDKLRVPSGALTFNDVRGPLLQKGVAPETLDALKTLFSDCEAARYGHRLKNQETDPIFKDATDLIKKLEKTL